MSIERSDRRKRFKTTLARDLRANATDAERRLWRHLRGKQMASLRFRRQQPIGPYVVDFYCSAARLVIELDGSQHGEEAAVAYDERRTRWLSEQGYRVIRFGNVDVLRSTESVLDGIWHVLQERGIPGDVSV